MQREGTTDEAVRAARARSRIIAWGGGLLALNAVLALALLFPTPQGGSGAGAPGRGATSSEQVQGAGVLPRELQAGTASVPSSAAPDTPPTLPTRTPSPVSIPVLTPGTVLDAMRAYDATPATFSFATREYPGIGSFVEEVNGVREGGGMHWILYINGRTSDLGASQAQVRPGDRVLWRFEHNIFGP